MTFAANTARNRPSRPLPKKGAPVVDMVHYATMHAPVPDLDDLLRKKNAPVTSTEVGARISHEADMANPTGGILSDEALRAENRKLF